MGQKFKSYCTTKWYGHVLPFRDAHKYPYKHIGWNQHPKKLCDVVKKKKINGASKLLYLTYTVSVLVFLGLLPRNDAKDFL